MKLNPTDAAKVLTAFIREDRAETRIYRSRVQQVSYILVVASFAISAFLIGNVRLGAQQLRNVTLLIDLGLAVVMFLFFGLIRPDLVLLRKGMKKRQDLLNGLNEHDNETHDIDVFPPVDDVVADIKDSDLYFVVGLSAAVMLLKMAILLTYVNFFVTGKGTT